MDQDIKDLLTVLIQSQSDAHKAIADMAAVVTGFVDGSDARMKRLEANLDGLIQAIAKEHGNGRKKQ